MDGLYGPIVPGAIQFRLNCIRDIAYAAARGEEASVLEEDCMEDIFQIIGDYATEVYNLFLGLNEDGSFVKE